MAKFPTDDGVIGSRKLHRQRPGILRELRSLVGRREGDKPIVLDHDRWGNPLAPPSYELIPWNEAPILPSHEAVDKKLRAKTLDIIETARTSVRQELATLRRTGNSADHHALIAQLEHRLTELEGLRTQVQNANGTTFLLHLQALATAAAHGGSDQSASAAATQAGYTFAALSYTEYQRATAELDQRIAQSYAAEAPHLAYAHDVAKRYGIDISGFTQERKTLESERDEARRKGDKLAERTADALIAHNTFNTLATELDHIKEPEARRRHLDEMRAQQKIVDERRTALAAQVELEARRQATDRNLTPDQAKTFIDDFKKQKLQEFDDRTKTLKGADKAEAARALLESMHRAANTTEISKIEPPKETSALVASLSPEARAQAQRAASALRAADEGPDAEPSLSTNPARHGANPEPSKIALSTAADAHEKVETPKTPSKADSGKSTGIA